MKWVKNLLHFTGALSASAGLDANTLIRGVNPSSPYVEMKSAPFSKADLNAALQRAENKPERCFWLAAWHSGIKRKSSGIRCGAAAR